MPPTAPSCPQPPSTSPRPNRSPPTAERTPLRTCVGCRARRAQGELLRLARRGDGTVEIDRTAPGRGAWLCRDGAAECFALARRRKAFSRAFRRPVAEGALDALGTLFVPVRDGVPGCDVARREPGGSMPTKG